MIELNKLKLVYLGLYFLSAERLDLLGWIYGKKNEGVRVCIIFFNKLMGENLASASGVLLLRKNTAL